ncbi:FtsB family cell division protein [Metabacillus fastidiosus]|uniref:FtsB family cell division protein n=1 Tax=Metabacillus fastidiosus TaxID=1458 RepID=UPI002DB6136A|nr:septum formation initiator family protein [Metabacillus fastidiosus]MEC2076605.1 septum formation initiator family protein [Metabacillus fastidiosus]
MGIEKKKKVAKLESQYVMQQERNQEALNRRKKGLMRRLTIFAVLIVSSSIFMLSTLFSQSGAIEEKAKEQEVLADQLKKLKKEEKILNEEIVKLNDDEYIAKIARRDYFLSNENEIIFNIPDEN